ncbi:hypothetical protein COV19_05380 [Candidatus Woesearchaeota archaeon CG10_big_fil_rev_8_21_14_0_10_44_13]|nr:MAG: hypothetical protein COV19_05380 [Candidatus Woesearchaeota archaeon CG10_big_fil_rev_8_21_14_0_10_44_13]
MRVLFVYSMFSMYKQASKPLADMIWIQMGISYISSLLKSKGHDTDLLILTERSKKSAVKKMLSDFRPSVIFFTAVFSEYETISRVATFIKKEFPGIYLVIGGPHVSLNPEDVIAGPFDAVCIGEGEFPSLELVNQIDAGKEPSRIKNLWIKRKRGIEKNPTRYFIKDLDSLPFPDREIWKKWAVCDADKMQVILLGRGCPFDCTYCSNHALRKLASGIYVRFRSAENVIKELEDLVRRFSRTEHVYFEVETLGADMKFAFDLCSRLREFNRKNRSRISYGVNLRIIPGVDYNLLFSSLKSANFISINIGLESGSQRIRETVLNRHYSNEDFFNVVSAAKRNGLKANVNLMIGLPDESIEDFKETIQCIRESQPDEARLGIFFPYPGTKIYRLCRKKGLLKGRIDNRMERRVAVLDLPGFSKRQIKHEYEWFYYDAYTGKKSIYDLLMSVVYRKIFSNRFLYGLSRRINPLLQFRLSRKS